MAKAAKDVPYTALLMPMATAVWLTDNTILTFKQIADFTGLSTLEIESIADGDIGKGILGRHPVENNELTQEELDRCAADPKATLVQSKSDLPSVKIRGKGPRYTPVSKRGDKPDAIAYIIKNNPEISDAQICKLVGTTKPTIEKIRDRSHPSMSTLKPRHPTDLGLCNYADFEKAVDKGLKAAGKDPEAVKAERLAAEKAVHDMNEEAAAVSDASSSRFDFSNFLGTDSGSDTSD